jgi:hypothetical protein
VTIKKKNVNYIQKINEYPFLEIEIGFHSYLFSVKDIEITFYILCDTIGMWISHRYP